MPTPSIQPNSPHPQHGAPGTFLFVGGGSGGHLYPGLAIAEEIRRLAPGARCVFVCSDRAIDARVLGGAGAEFFPSPARPVNLRPRGLLAFMRAWPKAVTHARGIIRDARARGPVHMVAMGGFVAAPCVRAAQLERCPATIPATMVNLDAVPGKANRWIAPRVARVFSAADVPAHLRPKTATPWINVPPIVRSAARAQVDQRTARLNLGLNPDRPVLMVTTGSQGLRSVNEFVAGLACTDAGKAALGTTGGGERWQVLHQTGRSGDAVVRQKYQDAGVDAVVVEFTDQMGLWWSAADLAVCTAGAGNVAEVWCSATPAMLLPYPHHRDQHQKYNARVLEHAGGVVVVTDHVDTRLNVERNGAALLELLKAGTARATMRAALERLGPADGAERIARAVLIDEHR